MRLLEYERASWFYCLLTNLTRLARKVTSFCLQETHGKDEFPQAVQVLHTEFWVVWYIHAEQSEYRRVSYFYT